ncbi:unnamed protein product [Victoria cruziana]
MDGSRGCTSPEFLEVQSECQILLQASPLLGGTAREMLSWRAVLLWGVPLFLSLEMIEKVPALSRTRVFASTGERIKLLATASVESSSRSCAA